jgi:hypothetical protein
MHLREAAAGSRIDPEEEALLADSVGLALYVVMDALTPAERVSFILHDVFEIPFDAIAAILGVRGANEVAAQARTGARPGALARPVLVDGLPGVLIMVGGRPVTVMAFMITGGAITAIQVLTDPDRLAQVVPSWIA